MAHHPVLVARMADAQPGAAEIGADMGGDRAHAVIAGRPAARLHPEAPGGQVDLVVEQDQVGGLDLVELQRLADGAAGLVVEGLGFHDQHLDGAVSGLDLALANQALELRTLGAEAPAACDLIHGHEADIVPVARMTRARIALARENQHVAVP